MSSSKADLLCSPNHDDKFVIFGQELNLYKVGCKPCSHTTFASRSPLASKFNRERFRFVQRPGKALLAKYGPIMDC